MPTYKVGLFEQLYVDLMAEQLNFTYQVVLPKDSISPGMLLPNSTIWTGAMGQLQRKVYLAPFAKLLPLIYRNQPNI